MKGCALKTDTEKVDWYEKEIKKIDPNILALKLARPALRALVNASIYNVSTLRSKSTSELMKLHGLGPTAIKKLKSIKK
jgi:hypothetical protein